MQFSDDTRQGKLNNQSPFFLLNTTQNFTLKNKWTAELRFNYESPCYYGLYYFKALHILDAGISKSLMDNKINLKLAITDIFNNKRDQYSTTFKNLNLKSVEKTESRIVSLNFSYRFGKNTVKSTRRRSTSSEEESKRIRN